MGGTGLQLAPRGHYSQQARGFRLEQGAVSMSVGIATAPCREDDAEVQPAQLYVSSPLVYRPKSVVAIPERSTVDVPCSVVLMSSHAPEAGGATVEWER